MFCKAYCISRHVDYVLTCRAYCISRHVVVGYVLTGRAYCISRHVGYVLSCRAYCISMHVGCVLIVGHTVFQGM